MLIIKDVQNTRSSKLDGTQNRSPRLKYTLLRIFDKNLFLLFLEICVYRSLCVSVTCLKCYAFAGNASRAVSSRPRSATAPNTLPISPFGISSGGFGLPKEKKYTRFQKHISNT